MHPAPIATTNHAFDSFIAEGNMKAPPLRILQELAREVDARTSRPRKAAALDILLVDDDDERHALDDALTLAGHRVTHAPDTHTSIALCTNKIFDVAIIDVSRPRIDGKTVFRTIGLTAPATRVIVTSAVPSASVAIDALRQGADDYAVKPLDTETFVRRVIGHIAEHVAVLRELEAARRAVECRIAVAPILGEAPATMRLMERVVTVAQSSAAVLLHGEPGSGKALVARTIHAHGPRKWAPFIDVDCVQLSNMPSNETLFGNEHHRDGYVRAAHSGTLYLAEVSALSLEAQGELLQVLRERERLPEAGNPNGSIDVRVVTSTRTDLAALVNDGRFREDLFHSLRVLDIRVPPLRERMADIPLLLSHFLTKSCPGRIPPSLSPRAWQALTSYSFPGNVRELLHTVERAVALSHGAPIDLEHLPDHVARNLDSDAIL